MGGVLPMTYPRLVIANPRFAWVKQSSVFKDMDCFVARGAPRNDEEWVRDKEVIRAMCFYGERYARKSPKYDKTRLS